MAHTQEDQEKLNSLTAKEKYEMTSLEEFEKRGNIIEEYDYWFITDNEMPHTDRGDEQYIIWEKNTEFEPDKLNELMRLLYFYGNYNILKNSPENKSVYREHWHIFDSISYLQL